MRGEGKRLRSLFSPQELHGGDLGDVAHVDHGKTLVADRHRVDAIAGDDILDRQIVLDEVGRAQDRRVKAHLLDHALDGELAGEVRNGDVDTSAWITER